jgi:4-hydroxybenzoate polyprenyltransferase
MGSIKDYFILIRIPNLFTCPSNVIVGFAQVGLLISVVPATLLLLILASLLLYTVGIVLNDYLDRHADKRDRSNRPLPSGRISSRSAAILIVLASLSSVFIAAYVSSLTLFIVLAILGTIIAYDAKLKSSSFGHLAMALSRVLNIVLGFSPFLFLPFSNTNDYLRIGVILICMFIYIFVISYVSKFESSNLPKEINYTFVLISIFSIPILLSLFTVTGYFKTDLLLLLPIFVGILIFTFGKIRIRSGLSEAGPIVRNLVLSIVVLDSLFMSGSAGLAYGLGLMVFLIPALLLSSKFYVT